jgi:hypothetical protein
VRKREEEREKKKEALVRNGEGFLHPFAFVPPEERQEK